MGTRKKGSELVFNLQWRNMPDNGGDRSNVVGMYDTPATTLNFETFKSYLLKNSGVLVKDVKVTYLTDNGAEWIIDSPEGFEIALCAFRLKARLGEVIFLKLDKVTNHQMMRKHSNDVETQFDNDAACINLPPEWFLMYMKQFKRDLVEELTYAVSANMAAPPKEVPVTASVVVQSQKKVKSEPSKRSRKHMLLGETPIDKELLKTLKFDRKLEIKLDKLDAKTKKIKEKKQALISKLEQTEEPQQGKILHLPTDFEGFPWMDGRVIAESTFIPHMLGGEIYMHNWHVVNSGKLSWTTKTELRLTWGPSDMKPDSYAIRCPLLMPGEKGTISVKFQIPLKPGRYESHWSFYEGAMRFGQSLSCCVIVDGPVSYQTEKTYSKKPKIEQEETEEKKETFVMIQENSAADSEVEGAVGNSVIDLSKRMQDIKIVGSNKSEVDSDSDWESFWSYRKEKNLENNIMDDEERNTNKYGINEKDLIVDLSTSKENIIPSVEKDNLEKVEKVEKEEISNDDNNNNGCVNKASSEESICGIASEASSDLSSGYDVISAPICEEKEDSGYVYVTIDGNKLPVPKHILRPDFLANAEEAPNPVVTTTSEDKKNTITNEGNPEAIKLECQLQKLEQHMQETISHCSAAGTCFSDVAASSASENSRLFIFPQSNPGYEVVYPKFIQDHKPSSTTVPTWSHAGFQYNFGDLQNACNMRYDPYGPLDQSRPMSSQETTNPTFPAVPNFQQSNPRRCSLPPPHKPKIPTAPPPPHKTPTSSVQSPPVHILSENLVNGAVNVASSAINTARSVINMIVPPKSEPGKWVNGHWVTENIEPTRAKNLCILADMGFWDQDLNATLLARYNDDISRVVSELLQQ